jgi:hypothetical protein
VNAFPNELRLLIAIVVNAALLIGCYRLARRFTHRSGAIAMMDALLLDYLVQYLLVCALGLLHLLSAESLYGTGSLIAAIFIGFSRSRDPTTTYLTLGEHTGGLAAQLGALFLIGYFIAVIYTVGTTATVSDDALMYHVPIPAIWLHDHQLTFFSTWFSNPANSYSPLAVETFMTWLMAPLGNDLSVHYVQMPGLLLMYFATATLLEGCGVSETLAVVIALAALLSRPFISQAILVKDDLFVASFFMVLLAGCRKELLSDRMGPFRVGIAAGLFFATKYIALQTAPLLLLLIDAPFRARWRRRHWLTALGTTLIIAGPWYLRNALVTGNPLYPVPLTIGGIHIFKGLFFPLPSSEMRTLNGIWKTLTGGYQGLFAPIMLALLLGAVGTIFVSLNKLRTDPLLRTAALGGILGLLLFFFISHASEIRYAYPSLILLFAASAIALNAIPLTGARLGIVVLLAGTCIATSFSAGAAQLIVGFAVSGLIAAGGAWVWLRVSRAVRWGSAGVIAVASLALIYVFWTSIVNSARTNMIPGLSNSYPELTPVWDAALTNVPPGRTIAYTNLALIRPAMGFDYRHMPVYVPTRPGVVRPDDLPASDVHLREPEFRPYMSRLLSADPDRAAWLAKLTSSGAGVLIVGKTAYLPAPPELGFAESDPQRFLKVYENPAAAVFRVLP